MTHVLGGSIVAVLTLIASILVLLYSLWYFFMLYLQHKHDTIRPDWKISSLFYVGIILITLAHIFTTTHACLASLCFEEYFNPLYLIALILFVYGFEKRAGTAQQITSQLQKPAKQKKR